jgi:hypothetical protein
MNIGDWSSSVAGDGADVGALVGEKVDEGASDVVGRAGDQDHGKTFSCTGNPFPGLALRVPMSIRLGRVRIKGEKPAPCPR